MQVLFYYFKLNSVLVRIHLARKPKIHHYQQLKQILTVTTVHTRRRQRVLQVPPTPSTRALLLLDNIAINTALSILKTTHTNTKTGNIPNQDMGITTNGEDTAIIIKLVVFPILVM